MSLFDEYPTPEPAVPAPVASTPAAPLDRPDPPARPRPTIHTGVGEFLKPQCGGTGDATVLPALVTCPACLSLRKAAERPPQTVYRRAGFCLACSNVATDGEFCTHHASIVTAARDKAAESGTT